MHSEGCCFEIGGLNGKISKICLKKLSFNKPWRLFNVSERINALVYGYTPTNSNFETGGGMDAAAGREGQDSSSSCFVRSNTFFSSLTVHQAGKARPHTM